MIALFVLGAGLIPLAVWNSQSGKPREYQRENRLAEQVQSAVASTPDHADICAVLGLARGAHGTLQADSKDIEAAVASSAREALAERDCPSADAAETAAAETAVVTP